MRILTLAGLLAARLVGPAMHCPAAPAADLPAGGTEAARGKGLLQLKMAIEDARPAKIKVEIKQQGTPSVVIKTIEDVPPGSVELPLAGVPDGDYLLYLSSPGYATRWQAFKVTHGQGEPAELKAKLFRKRYVVLRFVFNTSGGRDFSDEFSILAGRAAVSHWGNLKYFHEDWQIWQKSAGADLFGDTPFLDFHRYSAGFGFFQAPPGAVFDDLKEAPADARYQCVNLKAEKGLTLFCRVMGNSGNNQAGLGYGKLIIEDVTETPPPGVKLIDAP